jgi:hypothetical protein
MRRTKLSRYEKKKAQEERRKNNLSGTGVYIYENNTDADLNLPKPTETGIRNVGPRKRFEGDSYYMQWVGSPMNLLRLIEQVLPTEKENQMQEKKLILDQPDTVNNQGKVEHVVSDQAPQTQESLNDNTQPNPNIKKPDVLLNESPVDGVEIIFG